MPRYDTGDNVLEAEVDAIDVVAMSGQILAYAAVGSAFGQFIISNKANRKGILGRQAEVTWGTRDLDAIVAVEPDGQAFTPTSRTYECAGHGADVIIGQKALADARTSGKTVTQMVREQGGLGYIKYADGLAAAVWDEAPTAGPDNTFGSSADVTTAGLLNTGIRALFAAGATPPFGACFHVSEYENIMAIPGMQEKSVLGDRSGALDLGVGAPTSPIIVRGWNNVLTIALSDQVKDSASAYHNMMWSYNENTPGLINKWTPLEMPGGITPNKLLLDIAWASGRRAIEMVFTTNEIFQGHIGSLTANDWMVDIMTSSS